jgi:HEPN domain-containing protein
MFRSLSVSRLDGLGCLPERIRFKSYLEETEVIKDRLLAVRSGEVKKTSLPAIIPAGIFKGGYQIEHLRRLTGYASFDIDKLDEARMDEVRDRVKDIPWVCFLSESVSGKGLWGLVRFADRHRHIHHYSALIEEFSKRGVELDPTSANVNRLRFYSYDPNPYVNEEAEVFSKMSLGGLRTADGITLDSKIVYEYKFTSGDSLVMTRFNETKTCLEFLLAAGWEITGENFSRESINLLRPGSDKSRSGNIRNNRFWCYTSSTNFPQGSLCTPFDCYVYLVHGGNVRSAIKMARSMIY